MSEGERQDDAEAWRRLRACPGCDYSLETLPAEGVCPECGRRYDQRFVVLTGVGRGMQDNAAGGTWRGTGSQLVWVVFLVWVLAMGRHAMKDPQMIGWGVIAVIALAAQLYARLFSAREPRMQLWLSAEGVAQVGSTPEARWAQWVTTNVWWLFVPVGVGAICFQQGLWLGVIASGAVAGLMLGGGAWWWRRSGGGRAEGAEYVPALCEWGRVERIEVKVLPRDRARVRCRVMRRWGWMAVNKLWVVDVEIACTAGVAEGLRRQMAEWRLRAQEGGT